MVHMKPEVKHRVWIVNICCAAIVIWPLACSLLLSPIFGPCLLLHRLIATIETRATFLPRLNLNLNLVKSSAWNEFFVPASCPYYGWKRLLYFACFLAFFLQYPISNVNAGKHSSDNATFSAFLLSMLWLVAWFFIPQPECLPDVNIRAGSMQPFVLPIFGSLLLVHKLNCSCKTFNPSTFQCLPDVNIRATM